MELDGTILKGSLPASHLKPFHTRMSQNIPEPLSEEEDSSDELYPFHNSDETEEEFQFSN
jgi:hypothetical protein